MIFPLLRTFHSAKALQQGFGPFPPLDEPMPSLVLV
jgi:hypothetical protein